jgi:uncharacterized protein DUF3108
MRLRSPYRELTMLRCVAATILFFSVASALAGDVSTSRVTENNDASPASGQATQAAGPVNMAEAAVGDHWTYDVRDEIAGTVILTRKYIVSDVSGGQIATRVDVINNSGQSGSIVYDKSWNILRDGANRYSPNSGTGIQLPLKLNAEWKAAADEINGNNGNAWKIAVSSRVTGQDNVTTKAGTFDTYMIETTQAVRNTKNPSANAQITIRTWFAPEVNHWVRRNFVRRVGGLIVGNETMELVEYGRKNAE